MNLKNINGMSLLHILFLLSINVLLTISLSSSYSYGSKILENLSYISNIFIATANIILAMVAIFTVRSWIKQIRYKKIFDLSISLKYEIEELYKKISIYKYYEFSLVDHDAEDRQNRLFSSLIASLDELSKLGDNRDELDLAADRILKKQSILDDDLDNDAAMRMNKDSCLEEARNALHKYIIDREIVDLLLNSSKKSHKKNMHIFSKIKKLSSKYYKTDRKDYDSKVKINKEADKIISDFYVNELNDIHEIINRIYH